MATHSKFLARRIPWAEEPGWLQPMGLQRVRRDLETNTFTFTSFAYKGQQDTKQTCTSSTGDFFSSGVLFSAPRDVTRALFGNEFCVPQRQAFSTLQ